MCQVTSSIVFVIKIFYLYFFRLFGHKEINERLNESMYEVLDVLSMYVFGRKAEHKNGEHMINFNVNDEYVKDGDQLEAIKKMKQVNFFFKFNNIILLI